jgi:Nuclear pore localisation protein NPL4
VISRQQFILLYILTNKHKTKMAAKSVTLAVQSPEGQKRVTLAGGTAAKTEDLYAAVAQAFGLPAAASDCCAVYKDQRKTELIQASRLKSLASVGLKHGDRVFMFPKTPTSKASQVLWYYCFSACAYLFFYYRQCSMSGMGSFSMTFPRSGMQNNFLPDPGVGFKLQKFKTKNYRVPLFYCF